MKKLIAFLLRVFVFLLIAGFSFLVLLVFFGSLGASGAWSAFAAFILPIITGVIVTSKIFSEEETADEPHNDTNSDITALLEKESSALAIIRDEMACLNWQIIIGSLILLYGLLIIFLSFFFGIMVIVFGLGLLSVGGTKYKEKQEMRERALLRKLLEATAKESPAEKPTTKEPPIKTEAPAPSQPKPSSVVAQPTKCKTYKVAGVTRYAENIEELGIENVDYTKTKRELIDEGMTDERIWKYLFYPDKVELIPEPENPHDPNAIMVIVDDIHVGYIKQGSCSHVYKLLREDLISDIDCTIGGGPYKFIAKEYDDEKDKEVYVLEKDSTNFFVHLQIAEKIIES